MARTRLYLRFEGYERLWFPFPSGRVPRKGDRVALGLSWGAREVLVDEVTWSLDGIAHVHLDCLLTLESRGRMLEAGWLPEGVEEPPSAESSDPAKVLEFWKSFAGTADRDRCRRAGRLALGGGSVSYPKEIDAPKRVAARSIEVEAEVARLRVSVAVLLEHLRAESGLSRAELARRLGVGRTIVTRLLSGSANPTLETLARFSLACGRRLEVRESTASWIARH